MIFSFRGVRIGLCLAAMAAGLSSLLSSCATSLVPKVDEVRAMPSDIPTEFQSKFVVNEVGAVASPSPSPAASGAASADRASTPAPSAKPKKLSRAERRKQEKEAAALAAAAPMVYPNRRPKVDPVWLGEKMTFDITYFGMVAGEFTTEVLPYKEISGRKVYHLKASAESSKVFALFYRLNDWLESFYDYEGLFSHRFHLVQEESRQSRDVLELYDSEKKKAFYWNRRRHIEKGYTETKEFQDTVAFPQDSFSALYYLRTLPLEDGKVYSFPVVSEGKTWEAVMTVLKREDMDTPLGRKTCIKIKPQTKFQGVLQQKKGDSFIWLIDDARRYLARLEAEVKVGTVVAALKRVEPGEPPQQ